MKTNTLPLFTLLLCISISYSAQAEIEITSVRPAGNTCNGMVLFTVEGDAGPFDVTLTNSSNNYQETAINGKRRFIRVCSGTYQFTVTDAFGCIHQEEVIVPCCGASCGYGGCNLGEVQFFDIMPEIPVGFSTGSVRCAASGTTNRPIDQDMYVKWSDGFIEYGTTQSNREHLSAGTYHVTIAEDECCFIKGTVVIEAHECTISHTVSTTCDSEVTGDITFDCAGEPVFNYEWRQWMPDGSLSAVLQTMVYASTGTLNNIEPGRYQLKVTDNLGCENETTIEIPNYSDGIEVTDLLLESSTCPNSDDGRIYIQSINNGATHNYSFQWSNGTVTANNNYLPSGYHTVTITAPNGCQRELGWDLGSDHYDFTPKINIATTGDCDENSGTVFIDAQQLIGHLSYTYQGNNNTWQGDNFEFELDAGSYTVTITDQYNCTFVENFEIIDEAPPLVNATIQDACNWEGSIELDIDFDYEAEYEVYWHRPIRKSGEKVENLRAGNYRATLSYGPKDSPLIYKSCQSNYDYEVEQKPQIESVNINAPCETKDGSISVQATNATPPVQYLWSWYDEDEQEYKESNGSSLNNISEGSYRLKVTDGDGCEHYEVFEIRSTPFLTSSITSACVNDPSGSITLTVTDGNAPYHYNWSTGATTANLTDLLPGGYKLTITDANGCFSEHTFKVEEEAFDFDFLEVNTCDNNDGAILLTNHSPDVTYNYAWNTGANTASITGLSAGTYTLTITSTNCEIIKSFEVQEEGINLSFERTNLQDCEYGQSQNNQGSIEAIVKGALPPITYEWNTGDLNPTLQGLSNIGAYSITVTDSRGCTATGTTSLYCCIDIEYENGEEVYKELIRQVEVTPTLTPTSSRNASDGAIHLNISSPDAPYTIKWTDDVGNELGNTENLTNLSYGTYCVEVSNGCSEYQNCWSIRDCDGVVFDLSITDVAYACGICGETTTGQASVIIGDNANTFGPYSYQWSNGATGNESTGTIISHNNTGGFSVEVTDGLGCTTVKQASLRNGGSSLNDPYACTSTCLCNEQPINNPIKYEYDIRFLNNNPEDPCAAVLVCPLNPSFEIGVSDGVISEKIGEEFYVFENGNCIYIPKCRISFSGINPLEKTNSNFPRIEANCCTPQTLYFPTVENGILTCCEINYCYDAQNILRSTKVCVPADDPSAAGCSLPPCYSPNTVRVDYEVNDCFGDGVEDHCEYIIYCEDGESQEILHRECFIYFVSEYSIYRELGLLDCGLMKQGNSTTPFENSPITKSSSVNIREEPLPAITVFPNPFSQNPIVRITNAALKSDLEIFIYNSLGENIFHNIFQVNYKAQQFEISDLIHVPSGIYFLTFQTNGQIIDSQKIIKINPN